MICACSNEPDKHLIYLLVHVPLLSLFTTRAAVHLPPFAKADVPIIVVVYIVEKGVQFPVGHHEPSLAKGFTQLVLIELAIAIPVDGVEEQKQLLFRLLDKGPELYERSVRWP